MQFKNPEILYFLFLLIIPILIHLFQLQRFQKTAFTNVKLLREIKQQTRKSSKLKKLLLLFTRLLLLTSLIIAFAQPFLIRKNKFKNVETFIYLDNSFSMQAKGNKGELLQTAKNELIENINDQTSSVTLLTNNEVYKNLNSDELKNELINTNFYAIKKDLKTILLQINNLKNNNTNTLSDIVLITDFQDINTYFNELYLDTTSQYSFIQTTPIHAQNISIDSLWISEENSENLTVKCLIRSHGIEMNNLSISLQINNELSGKTNISLQENGSSEVEFIVPKKNSIQGKISLNDNKLLFDNNFYFSVSQKEKKNILAIGENNLFLSKIYTKEEFNFKSVSIEQLDYSIISQQDLIILNDLKDIPLSIIQALKFFIENEGNLVIIPSFIPNINSYNSFLSELNVGKILNVFELEKRITTINYTHPFFKNVFRNQIDNFQYPKVDYFIESNMVRSTAILQFEDKTNFLSEIKINNNKLYWFASSLHEENSNFSNSPLVVPVFYNFSLKGNIIEKLYYNIGDLNEIIVKENNNKEKVLHLANSKIDFIPLQFEYTNHIKIQTEDNPVREGVYQIKNEDSIFKNVAFNYNREESKMTYFPIEKWSEKIKNVNYYRSVEKAIKQNNDNSKDKKLWQLFIIFALVFLIIEVILQKFLKS